METLLAAPQTPRSRLEHNPPAFPALALTPPAETFVLARLGFCDGENPEAPEKSRTEGGPGMQTAPRRVEGDATLLVTLGVPDTEELGSVERKFVHNSNREKTTINICCNFVSQCILNNTFLQHCIWCDQWGEKQNLRRA